MKWVEESKEEGQKGSFLSLPSSRGVDIWENYRNNFEQNGMGCFCHHLQKRWKSKVDSLTKASNRIQNYPHERVQKYCRLYFSHFDYFKSNETK